jgi:hypothetical protein
MGVFRGGSGRRRRFPFRISHIARRSFAGFRAGWECRRHARAQLLLPLMGRTDPRAALRGSLRAECDERCRFWQTNPSFNPAPAGLSAESGYILEVNRGALPFARRPRDPLERTALVQAPHRPLFAHLFFFPVSAIRKPVSAIGHPKSASPSLCSPPPRRAVEVGEFRPHHVPHPCRNPSGEGDEKPGSFMRKSFEMGIDGEEEFLC